MADEIPDRPSGAPASRAAATAVHVFTASGAALALLAAHALWQHRYEAMFFWLGIALVVDAVDGTLARRARVAEVLPRFSGERLDLVIDYVTYVFIPALALLAAGRFPPPLAEALAVLVVVSALFHFADTRSKAADNSFIGFPAVWNLVAFMVLALDMGPWPTAMVVSVLAGLTFVPWRWVHPFRVMALRGATLAVAAAWGVAALWTVSVSGFPSPLWAQGVLAAGALWGIGLAVVRRNRLMPP